MNFKQVVEAEVKEASWNLRGDIRSICGVYDTVITDKMEKAMTQAMRKAAMAIVEEMEAMGKQRVKDGLEYREDGMVISIVNSLKQQLSQK